MKVILTTMAVIIIAFFGYVYFSAANLPQECLDYKKVYNESISFLESKNSNGSLTSTINMLKQTGEQLDATISPEKKYKRNKIEELKAMCLQAKTLTENALGQFKKLIN